MTQKAKNEDDHKWRRPKMKTTRKWRWPKMKMTQNEHDQHWRRQKWRRPKMKTTRKWRWLKMKTTQNEHDQNWSWQKWRRPKPSKIYCIVILCWKQTNRPTDRLSEIVRLMAGALHSIVLNQLPENLIEILIKNQFIFQRKSLEELVFKPRST